MTSQKEFLDEKNCKARTVLEVKLSVEKTLEKLNQTKKNWGLLIHPSSICFQPLLALCQAACSECIPSLTQS